MTAVAGTYGLQPANLIGGQVYAGAVRQIPIASGYAQNIGYGDLVAYTTDGTIVRVDTASGAKTAFAAAPIGIFLGCSYTDPNLKYFITKQYWPSGTVASDAYAVICEDPDIILRAALTNGSGTLYTASGATQAFVGENAGYYQPSTLVNTATGNATVSVNFASRNTTSTLPFRVIALVPESILTDGTYSEVLVTYNFGLHFYRQATGI